MSFPIISIERLDVIETVSPVGLFKVTLSQASSDEVSVDFSIRSGTFTTGFYQGIRSGTLTIAAGETTGLINLQPYDDGLDEVDQSVFLELSNAKNAVLAGGEKTLSTIGVVQDDDGTGSNLALFVKDAVVTEGKSGTKAATFEVHLSRAYATPLDFKYKTVDGTAHAGSDYAAKSGTVHFDAGQTVATVDVAVKGDKMLEGDETFSLVLKPTSAIKNGTLGSTAKAMVFNDDTINEVLYGTSRGNKIQAGSGNDRVYGLGGGDKLFGETGNDRLYGGDGSDHLSGGSGRDALYGQNGKDRLRGDSGDDQLSGGDGNDRLSGGTGKDKLVGGNGNDAFLFDAGLSAKSNVDTVDDFSHSHDVMWLDHNVFKGLAKGKLSDDAFHLGTKAADFEDRILYDKKHGDLYFDRDGSRSGHDPVKFASVDDNTKLDHTDFLIV